MYDVAAPSVALAPSKGCPKNLNKEYGKCRVAVQERGCFVFAFAGPQEVRELELGTDMASVNNLLGFLEKVCVSTPLAAGCKRLTQQS